MRTKQLSVGDLFAGIGGVALGFKQAEFEVSWANEIDPKAAQTYRANHQHPLFEKGITEFIDEDDPHVVDVICGGFPCQAFSIAGRQKGFEDKRGAVFFEMLRLIDRLKPRAIFLENVRNLISHDQGKTLQTILTKLGEIGYQNPLATVINTKEHSNLPQNRERIYIVGFRDLDDLERFQFPNTVEEQMPFRTLLDSEVGEEFYYENSKYFELLSKNIVSEKNVYQLRRVYVRELKNGICPTLTANMGTGGHNVPLILHNGRIRKLTPRECLRVQGFPENYILPNNLSNSARYKQIGNSVSVPVVRSIAENIKIALGGNTRVVPAVKNNQLELA